MAKKKLKKKGWKKNKMMYMTAGLLIGIFILTAGMMALMLKDEIVDPGPPPESEKQAHLMVEDVFFMKTDGYRATNEWTDITATVYITNDGMADAENVKIIAYPIDKDKNLALDKVDTINEDIPAQETAEIEFMFTVPSGTRHDVKLLIFERNRLILRGSGSVVIQGSYTNTPTYRTEEVRGTQNDTDYDGIADSWERYYGLDPTNPDDAKKDYDGDGLSNLAEYIAGSQPCEPAEEKDKKEEASMDSTVAVGGFVGIIIIIIVIMIIVAVVKAAQDQNKTYENSDNQTFPSPAQQAKVNSYHQTQVQGQVWPKPLARCIKCGGWVVNDVCANCQTRYPGNPQGSINNTTSLNDDQ